MTPSGAPTKQAVDPEGTVRQLDREWRRMRLSPADRRDLVGEVTADLSAAAADGVSPTTMVGADLPRFARESASARGYGPVPTDYGRTLVGGVLGLLVVGGATYAAITVVHWQRPDLLGLLWVVLAATCLLGTLAGVHLALRGRRAGRATVVAAAVLAPVALVAALIGWALGSPPAVGYAMVFVPCWWIAALPVARWWSLRG